MIAATVTDTLSTAARAGAITTVSIIVAAVVCVLAYSAMLVIADAEERHNREWESDKRDDRARAQIAATPFHMPDVEDDDEAARFVG